MTGLTEVQGIVVLDRRGKASDCVQIRNRSRMLCECQQRIKGMNRYIALYQ